jgi:uncharacterized protein Usg
MNLEQQFWQHYRLTTADILYHLPDHPRLLQAYIWQELDLAPKFPVLQRFLAFWESNLDGRLHSVKIASTQIVTPAEVRLAAGEFSIH